MRLEGLLLTLPKDELDRILNLLRDLEPLAQQVSVLTSKAHALSGIE
jgi:hypothetical protein